MVSAGKGSLRRDPGDDWVIAPDGRRFWGRFGAAGLLLADAGFERVLLQLRVGWSHFGGTWGIPGGALHEGEDAAAGALREAHEEAGVPSSQVQILDQRTLDLGFWSYTTVFGVALAPVEARCTDAESVALEWVAADEVTQRPLHPGFAESWQQWRAELDSRRSPRRV